MGRVPEYTTEQIIEAGLAIAKTGKTVTPFAIRERLHGGSPDRIKRIWDAYCKDAKSETTENVGSNEIELPTEIQEALDKNWKMAQKHLKDIAISSFSVATSIAEKRVTSTIEDYKSKISEYEESEKDAFQSLETSDREKAELENQIELLNEKSETLASDNARLSGMLETLQSRVSQLELKESELSELKIEYGKLQGKIEVIVSQKN